MFIVLSEYATQLKAENAALKAENGAFRTPLLRFLDRIVDAHDRTDIADYAMDLIGEITASHAKTREA